MNRSLKGDAKWKLCFAVSFAMVFLALLPDINLWIIRGRQWNGAYVSATGDEVIYSAYLNSLIDGRARKNDPFAGKDSTLNAPLPESTFSIQFIPPYVLSFLARLFGMSASTTLIVLAGITGLFSSLAIFWLTSVVVSDGRVAGAGTLFVLCLGGLAGGSGVVGVLLNDPLAMPLLPFLRRYQPAAAFPLFFVFSALVWQALVAASRRRAQMMAVFAGLTLVLLIFSYLYLWTAAVAWLACISILWFCFRVADRGKALAIFATIAAITAGALVPYGYLVSRRGRSMDETQALVSTHRPDLFWPSELLGLLLLVTLLLLVWRKRMAWTDPRTLYGASLAILPFLLFNQHVVTGYSLQPHHFAHFVANYCVLLGVVVTVAVFVKKVSARLLFLIGALSFAWALAEIGLTTHFASVPLAVARDQMIPVFLRLKGLRYSDGTIQGLRTEGHSPTVVFSPNIGVTRLLPTWTSQGTLLDMRGLDFGGASPERRRELFLMHLYYSTRTPQYLEDALQDRSHDRELNYYARSTIFGFDRSLLALTPHQNPIRSDEIESEIKFYEIYMNSFSREQALKRPLTYAIIPLEGNFSFTNIDRWYERDVGERVGDYVLYRLKLRP